MLAVVCSTCGSDLEGTLEVPRTTASPEPPAQQPDDATTTTTLPIGSSDVPTIDDGDSEPATTTTTTPTTIDDGDSEPATTTTTTPTTTDDGDSEPATTTTTTPTTTDDGDSEPATTTTTTPTTTDDGDSEPATTTTTTPTTTDDGDSEPATTTTTTPTTTDDGDSEPATTTTTTPSIAADGAVEVTAPPAELGLDSFYEKYLDLEGLPILAAGRVPDEALLQARLLIGEMLTDRRDVLATLAANNVRVAVMAAGSGITEIPELSDLYEAFPGVDWDNRTRGGGVGPTFARPVLAIAEENLLCYASDLFPYEDIVVHEAAHAVLNMGIELQSGGLAFRQRVERAFRDALDAGLWLHTYAAANADEYWAEGVQSWFGVNDPPGPIHNNINTRSELEAYDPALAGLIREALGEGAVSSCHSAASHPHSNSRLLGRVLGPNGAGVEGVVVWAWSGDAATSGASTTQPDGAFAIAVPDGSLTLDIHANTGEDCTFVGWYGPDGFTTVPESATLVVVDGADISGIEIILPQPRDDLPFIEWCA